MMRARVLIRYIRDAELMPKISLSDDKFLRKIEIERKALITYQQQAFKEQKIEPMIHIIEKIQDALKQNQVTPCEKLESSLSLAPDFSHGSFLSAFAAKYGNFSLDLYGTEQDLRIESIRRKGEIIPGVIKDEDAMIAYRQYYVMNPGLPGSIENINPNKFLRLKPKEEFPLLPLIPISPMTMKRWAEELEMRKNEGYRFRIDKGKLYSSILVISAMVIFVILLYFLFKKDEEHWVDLEKARKKRTKNESRIY